MWLLSGPVMLFSATALYPQKESFAETMQIPILCRSKQSLKYSWNIIIESLGLSELSRKGFSDFLKVPSKLIAGMRAQASDLQFGALSTSTVVNPLGNS